MASTCCFSVAPCCCYELLRLNPAAWCTQGMKLAPAATAVAVGLLLRYAAPIPEGLTDQVGAP